MMGREFEQNRYGVSIMLPNTTYVIKFMSTKRTKNIMRGLGVLMIPLTASMPLVSSHPTKPFKPYNTSRILGI